MEYEKFDPLQALYCRELLNVLTDMTFQGHSICCCKLSKRYTISQGKISPQPFQIHIPHAIYPQELCQEQPIVDTSIVNISNKKIQQYDEIIAISNGLTIGISHNPYDNIYQILKFTPFVGMGLNDVLHVLNLYTPYVNQITTISIDNDNPNAIIVPTSIELERWLNQKPLITDDYTNIPLIHYLSPSTQVENKLTAYSKLDIQSHNPITKTWLKHMLTIYIEEHQVVDKNILLLYYLLTLAHPILSLERLQEVIDLIALKIDK